MLQAARERQVRASSRRRDAWTAGQLAREARPRSTGRPAGRPIAADKRAGREPERLEALREAALRDLAERGRKTRRCGLPIAQALEAPDNEAKMRTPKRSSPRVIEQ